jgi:hypothetical protein
MSGSGRGSFAIQWHYILFGLEDLNQILGNLKRIFDSLLDGTKEAGAVSRGNLPDARVAKTRIGSFCGSSNLP